MSTEQWAQFRRKFPEASAWIDKTDLQNEYDILTSEKLFLDAYRERNGKIGSNDEKRLTWINGRLHELNALPMFQKKETPCKTY